MRANIRCSLICRRIDVPITMQNFTTCRLLCRWWGGATLFFVLGKHTFFPDTNILIQSETWISEVLHGCLSVISFENVLLEDVDEEEVIMRNKRKTEAHFGPTVNSRPSCRRRGTQIRGKMQKETMYRIKISTKRFDRFLKFEKSKNENIDFYGIYPSKFDFTIGIKPKSFHRKFEARIRQISTDRPLHFICYVIRICIIAPKNKKIEKLSRGQDSLPSHRCRHIRLAPALL